MNEFYLIRQWGRDKGITGANGTGTPMSQYVKLIEECTELMVGIHDKNKEEIKDAIGDCMVVLTLLADLEGMLVEECVEAAYNEIKNRTGRMVNGTFVKDE